MITRSSVDVTFEEEDTSRIPDALIEGAVLLLTFQRRGVVATVAERIQIRRQGGYCGLDVWLVLVLYMSMGAGVGVRKFWDLARPCIGALAALAGRRSLPSPAALSRALDAVECEMLREQTDWLLLDLPEVEPVLRHPACQATDAVGERWHLFDLDPTVTTLRHRSLPRGEDLPDPRRRSEETGAPGHSGRKRGDIQHRRITVQHAGSGAWVHAHLSPGNGEGVTDFELGLDAIGVLCDRLGHPRSRALVRMDGEYGNVPWFTACRERGLPFVTRLNRPKLYQDAEFLSRLRAATWAFVPDSGSGPRRSAADLGEWTVRPDRRTRRPDGSRYEPVKLRVIATRFPTSAPAKRGQALDGWQVELFAVDADPAAWPAPEAAAQFFARAGQENRFAQEDRELGLDRIVSYHLPGQELAALVGLSLWNLRLARGFELEQPPADITIAELRQEERDERAHPTWPRDPRVLATLAELDWAQLLQKRPGWTFDADTGELRCEEGRPLVLTTVRAGLHAKGRMGIIFCRPSGGCEDCEARAGCLRSARPSSAKHIKFSVARAIAKRLRDRLREVRSKQHRTTSTVPPGPRAVRSPLFLPARARRRFLEVFRMATLHAEVTLPAPEPPHPKLVAVDVADRQRRRRTWQQNVARYALAEAARVRVKVSGSSELRELMGEQGNRKGAVGGSM